MNIVFRISCLFRPTFYVILLSRLLPDLLAGKKLSQEEIKSYIQPAMEATQVKMWKRDDELRANQQLAVGPEAKELVAAEKQKVEAKLGIERLVNGEIIQHNVASKNISDFQAKILAGAKRETATEGIQQLPNGETIEYDMKLKRATWRRRNGKVRGYYDVSSAKAQMRMARGQTPAFYHQIWIEQGGRRGYRRNRALRYAMMESWNRKR